MKFNEKYPQLKEKSSLVQILTNTVFSTMALENQVVSKLKIEEIVSDLLKEQELKGDQFFSKLKFVKFQSFALSVIWRRCTIVVIFLSSI